MKLVWHLSGDEINLISVNPEVSNYFIAQLNKMACNRYNADVYIPNIVNLCEAVESIRTTMFNKFNIVVFAVNLDNILDQKVLNQLHSEWVNLHISYPQVETICEHTQPGSIKKFNTINKLIHNIEEMFQRYYFRTGSPLLPIPNIFGIDILSFNVSNISVAFNNLGRTTYNKWLNFDSDSGETCTNDFLEFYPPLIINLGRSYQVDPPREYVQWCIKRDKLPIGSTLNLANFDRLENNLLQYRQLFCKNIKISNNYFTLKE